MHHNISNTPTQKLANIVTSLDVEMFTFGSCEDLIGTILLYDQLWKCKLNLVWGGSNVTYVGVHHPEPCLQTLLIYLASLWLELQVRGLVAEPTLISFW